MPDRTLKCADCGTDFVFSESEQRFFIEKGFTNDPIRCHECRASRRARRGEGGSTGGGGGGGMRSDREMFAATCAQCGKQTQVPFQPRTDRPVYCSECYATVRGTSTGGSGGGGGGGYGGRSSGGSRGGSSDRGFGGGGGGSRGGGGGGRDRNRW